MRISKSVWSPILGLADFIVSLFLILACFSRSFFLSFFPFLFFFLLGILLTVLLSPEISANTEPKLDFYLLFCAKCLSIVSD